MAGEDATEVSGNMTVACEKERRRPGGRVSCEKKKRKEKKVYSGWFNSRHLKKGSRGKRVFEMVPGESLRCLE